MLDDAVATQDTVTQLIAAIRAVIREVPGAASGRGASGAPPTTTTEPGKPQDRLERRAGPRRTGRRAGHGRGEPAGHPARAGARRQGRGTRWACWRWSPARTWSPPTDSDGRDGRWRITQGTAYGPDGLHRRSRSPARPQNPPHHQDGFKAHLAIRARDRPFSPRSRCGPAAGRNTTRPPSAATCSPDEDIPVHALRRHRLRHRRGTRTPQEAGHRLVLKPRPAATGRPRRVHPRRLRHRHQRRHRDLPRRHTVAPRPLPRPHRTIQRKAHFKKLCAGCPLRERCTTAKAGRVLTIRPHHDLLKAARRQAATSPDWPADYRRWRPPVERAVAWLVARGNRRLRYRGTSRTTPGSTPAPPPSTSADSSTPDSPRPATPGTSTPPPHSARATRPTTGQPPHQDFQQPSIDQPPGSGGIAPGTTRGPPAGAVRLLPPLKDPGCQC